MDLNLPSVQLLETVSVFSRWLYSYKFSAVAEARFPPREGWELAGIAKCSLCELFLQPKLRSREEEQLCLFFENC